MTRNDLSQLSREDLIDLVIEKQAEIEALRLKLEKGVKPPSNSSNSPQPPSRDHKRSLPSDRGKCKHGSPASHPKRERKFVATPEHIVSVKAETCLSCHTDLRFAEGVLWDVNQIKELPPAKAEVIEVRQYAVICPECGSVHVEQIPAGLEMERSFGARLEATVVYYRQEQQGQQGQAQQARGCFF